MKYDESKLQMVIGMCKLGAIDVELAAALEVSLSTLNLWKVTHPKFAKALRVGKAVADARAEESLWKLVNGYSFDSEKIVATKDDVHRLAIVEHVPPNFKAIEFWLKNRMREKWRVSEQPAAVDPNALIDEMKADAINNYPDEPGPKNPIM